jgi:hypothetical protein
VRSDVVGYQRFEGLYCLHFTTDGVSQSVSGSGTATGRGNGARSRVLADRGRLG